MSDGDKAYIGDGVYVSFDGYMLRLTTEDGIRATNEIFLDPEVYEALGRYVARLRSGQAEETADL